MKFLSKLFGDGSPSVAVYQKRVKQINDLEPAIKELSDADLKAKTAEFKDRLKSGETLEQVLPEAFAVVREAAWRVLKQRPYDVQLIGGMVIHEGKIAEMRTGEGKTLVATLPSYLNALAGNGVHIVTVNDYLARRDAVWMGQIHDFLGLSVGVVNSRQSFVYDAEAKPEGSDEDVERDEAAPYKVVYEYLRPAERRAVYQCDIVYGTNSEFGFDYLRDNLEYDAGQLRQHSHAFAIVDEIDSILIDEARTPLIISAPAQQSESLYEQLAEIVRGFKEEEDYTVDEKKRQIVITEAGIEKAEKALGIENIYTEGGRKYVHHLENAVQAKALFKRDEKYVVQRNEVVIVDEFTGRMQPGRRFSMGLHQAIEAKERVKVQQESQTVASITYQNYFRLYDKLSGMTGTAETSKEEFYKVYGLDVVVIPTNKPIARNDRADLIFKNELGKFKAVAKHIKELQAKGQPILVGTVSVEKNELLSDFLKKQGVPHEVLNAKNHEREGEIVADAGRVGAVTIATNMAGRGVDIKLGGSSASPEEAEAVRELGGLYVIGTERHEARRIDNQLRGRAGRQGDPGETQFFVSLDDTLMRVFSSEPVKRVMEYGKFAEDEAISHGLISRSLESAQARIEGFHFDARKAVLEYDDVLNTQRKAIYSARRAMLTGSAKDVEGILYLLADNDEELEKILNEKKEQLGAEQFTNLVRRFYLQSLDRLWMEHLEEMDYLRASVNLRAYGQHDPLVEYKKEGLRLYRMLEETHKEQVLSMVKAINPEAIKKQAEEVQNRIKAAERAFERTSGGEARPVENVGKQYGRNDKITIINPDTNEEETTKYKHAEKKLSAGWRIKE